MCDLAGERKDEDAFVPFSYVSALMMLHVLIPSSVIPTSAIIGRAVKRRLKYAPSGAVKKLPTTSATAISQRKPLDAVVISNVAAPAPATKISTMLAVPTA